MSWNLIGHQWAAELLQGHIRQGAVRHAYLLTGPRGIGRRTLALRFAQALVCENPPAAGEFCGVCRSCRQMAAAQHPDLHLVQRPEGAQVIKIDQIRQLERSLSLTPVVAPRRIALLLDFEEAHPAAANALLKTLEEPPGQAVLLLTAESAEALLPTVASRCEVLRLRPVPPPQLSAALQSRHGLPPQEAETLAHIAGGRPGYALHLHQHPELLQSRRQALDDLLDLLSADLIRRFDYAAQAAKDRQHLIHLFTLWLSFWRDLLVLTHQAQVPLTNVDYHAQLDALAALLSPQQVQEALRALTRALEDLPRFVNPRLVAENVMLAFPAVGA